MPELPEVETIARELHSRIAGALVTGAVVRRADVLRRVKQREFVRAVANTTIQRAWRRAKTAVLDLSSGSRICVQPRFTGALLIEEKGAPLPADQLKYSTLHLVLGDERRLHYVDVRRLGTVALLAPDSFAAFNKSLGVEPLSPEFTPDLLFTLLGGSDQAVKKFIMDQHKLAGVGNIYANEALWRAGIDPSRGARKVPREAAHALHGAIVNVLTEAVNSRGTSFRDYRDASGEPGEFFSRLNVYGRAGQFCARCGSRLAGTHAIDGRATVFCPWCQR